MDLVVDRMDSQIGVILLVSDGATLRALDFEDHEKRMHRLLRLHYGPYRMTTGRAPDEIRSAIEAYFDGNLAALAGVPVQTGGTAFQRKVWSALGRIPAGSTQTYGALAQAIGSPGASRAVGLANGSNPVGIVVPCHRVIGANGTLTGYAGGVERKRWLLNHEGVRLKNSAASVMVA